MTIVDSMEHVSPVGMNILDAIAKLQLYELFLLAVLCLNRTHNLAYRSWKDTSVNFNKKYLGLKIKKKNYLNLLLCMLRRMHVFYHILDLMIFI